MTYFVSCIGDFRSKRTGSFTVYSISNWMKERRNANVVADDTSLLILVQTRTITLGSWEKGATYYGVGGTSPSLIETSDDSVHRA